MQTLAHLRQALGLTSLQLARLLHVSPTLLSHAAHGRRLLAALPLAYLEQAERIWMETRTGLSPPETGPDILEAEKELKKLAPALKKLEAAQKQMHQKMAQSAHKKAFALRLAAEAEIGPRPHHAFCQALVQEAEADLVLHSPLALARLEAQIAGLKAQRAFWESVG